MGNPILSDLYRGGRLESVHRGAVSAVRDGQEVLSCGDTAAPQYPRSALKPLQAVPLLEEGLDRELGLSTRQLALLTASHSGDEDHVAGVADMLAKAGIDPDALLCGAHPPLDPKAADRLVRAGQTPTALHNNCSGKHAGMLILARHLRAPLETYIDPGHPVQLRIRRTLATFCQVPERDLPCGIDGCSAPAFVLSLRALATGLARFVQPDGLPEVTVDACRRLFDAVQQEPHFLAGRRMFDQALVRGGRGRVFCKRGAEGILVLGVRAGQPGSAATGLAIKIDDGAMRGYFPVARALVEALGVNLDGLADQWLPMANGVVRNHRRLVVGELRPAAALANLDALREGPDPDAHALS